jgi:preprotein translocase subunit YajC
VKATDLLIFALPVLLLVFMFSSQRKRQRQFTSLQSSLSVGQDVLTTSGLYGRIVSLDDTVVVLETAPGQTVRWDRRAIASVISGEPAARRGLDDAPDAPDAPSEK